MAANSGSTSADADDMGVEVGDWATVVRKGEEKHVLVVDTFQVPADEWFIPTLQQTVAECNSDCPPDDEVVRVVFKETLDDRVGDWRAGDYLEPDTNRHSKIAGTGIRVYTYPESKLTPTGISVGRE